MNLNLFEDKFRNKMFEVLGFKDTAHDIMHVERVVKTAKYLSLKEKADEFIVVPAAWLHDFVNIAKDSKDRQKASLYSADAAIDFLKEIEYPEKYYQKIHHAIVAHSFSAKVSPETIEAKVVQDADRLDALGAIGIFRLSSVSTKLNRPFYDFNDPFAEDRHFDDAQFAIDHIEIKLKKIFKDLKTNSALELGKSRMKFIEQFLEQLKLEIM